MKTLTTMMIRNYLGLAGMLSTMVAQPWIVNVPSLPYSHGAGTTCGKGNNLTSSNAPLCGSASYYDSEDMVWVFTPTTSGQVTITLTHPSYGAWTGLMLYEGGEPLGLRLDGKHLYRLSSK
ncbi:MAG: hypothetical protein N2253_02145 [Bacteroidia bacterium]|nr:hypothetical protein [Bacteroidia bacterium]